MNLKAQKEIDKIVSNGIKDAMHDKKEETAREMMDEMITPENSMDLTGEEHPETIKSEGGVK